MGRIRLVDLAADLQVSVSTVSKALAESSEISLETRARVRSRAGELGYRPNGAARRLRTGTTRAIGLVSHDSIGWQSLPVLLGAEEAFGSEETAVLLSDGRGDPVRTRHHIRTLLDHGIDGLISLAHSTDDQASLGALGVPVVYAYGASDCETDHSVVPDEAKGAREAVNLLISLGRTRIGHVSGPDTFAATRRRARAAGEVLHSHGLEFAGGRPLLGDWTEHWGRAGTEALLEAVPDLDALFCGSDAIARGALDMLARHGRAVPSDVAVVGYDNWESLAAGSEPALTTVDMNLREVGRVAAEGLARLISGEELHGVVRLDSALVIRRST
ncbi:LacI family DNA-binding transcriptional regulator [Frigoribacterium sp. PvP032]|uniref:LacI family DNA-binding transcriptional regulator n=1 Tax=Frigoribacterium sp. PvP032 TaxID=2806589 RepID=UPI001AE50D8C|nr:LacI family DNA-binding transcriptional regulator [Frigoribacterium sp. PvP032]MBP1189502.1 LacI family transcriptional regulator [Frigoribacterium sp. PvP032]